MLHLPPPDTPEDAKRNRALEGAMKVVLAYGYARTTMDDIARAADMSRPALYLLFKNKGDIFRAIASRIFRASARQMAVIMAEDAPLGDRLFRSIDTLMIEVMRQIAESPHGAELLDLKNDLCGGLVEDWHNEVSGLFAHAIATEAKRLGTDLSVHELSSEALADMLLHGLEGMKQTTQETDRQRAAARQMVSVIELALRP